MTRVAAHDFDPAWFPVRLTFLRDGVVLETEVITDAGVLTVGRHGPGVVLVIEFGDGAVEVAKAPDSLEDAGS
jgi:hypothetical protein